MNSPCPSLDPLEIKWELKRHSCFLSTAILNLRGHHMIQWLEVSASFTRSSSPIALTSNYDSFCIVKLKCLVDYCNLFLKVSDVKASMLLSVWSWSSSPFPCTKLQEPPTVPSCFCRQHQIKEPSPDHSVFCKFTWALTVCCSNEECRAKQRRHSNLLSALLPHILHSSFKA